MRCTRYRGFFVTVKLVFNARVGFKLDETQERTFGAKTLKKRIFNPVKLNLSFGMSKVLIRKKMIKCALKSAFQV